MALVQSVKNLLLLKQNNFEVFTGQPFGLDLSAYFDPDYISVTCPDLSDEIDLENSFLEFTSSPDGEFLEDFSSVAFSETSNEVDLPGDTELRLPISKFVSPSAVPFWDAATQYAVGAKVKHNNVYWSALEQNRGQEPGQTTQWTKALGNITGIRFRISALETLVFKTMGIRAVSADWTYAPLDIDTLGKVLELPVSPNGDPDYAFDFPVETSGLEFNDWPITWQDIYPKNFSVSAEVFTGSLDGSNSIAIFFRGGNLNKGIVNDLENWRGLSSPATMEQLNGLSLETDIAEEDSSSLEYLGAKVTFSATAPSVEVFSNPDDENDRQINYVFDKLIFEPEKRYMITFVNERDSFRVKVYELDRDYGQITAQVFDSELISGYLFEPRQGFFGWWANLEDGDAFVDNVRHRHANFGDLRTRQFQSITPVAGVQLYHTSSSPKSLINSFGAAPWGGIVSEDAAPNTYKIVSQGKMEGIQTNEFVVSDWQNTHLQFEIKAAEGDYICYLLGANNNIVELDINTTEGEWKALRYDFDSRVDPTGPYRLVILKRTSNIETEWYVRNVQAIVKTIYWSARNQDDPWDMSPEEWTDFGETFNKTNSGIMFKEPGYVQVKASLVNNDAKISEFHVVPRYAQLGRLVFDEEDHSDVKHSAKIVAEVNKLSVNFIANVELSETDTRKPSGYLWIFDSNNEWSNGPFVRKKFLTSGVHHAFLQVTYDDGSVQTDFWQAFLTP